MAHPSARSIKQKQHELYNEALRQIEAGERVAQPFLPKSDFGQLKSSAKLQKKFSFA
ncbi:TPA: hypothetical protein OUE92_001718 [Serratia marcescens]|uniref:hypothetical protein n=1 Tax=Serratia marcescens TaxID=615 RepID=UPI000A6EB9BC|nr:hypothetical protein [Serratia marcescens]HCU0429562.1 hypothetical protein [Serratia marcescens]